MLARVLVVDDDEIVRSNLEVVLSLEGYQVRTAASGPIALRILDEEAVDLVLLDLSMPVLSGWETIAAMRAGPNGSAPVVAFTGELLDPVELRRAGFNAHLTKGSSLDQFLCTIRSVIAQGRRGAEVWLHSCNGLRCLASPLPGYPPVEPRGVEPTGS